MDEMVISTMIWNEEEKNVKVIYLEDRFTRLKY